MLLEIFSPYHISSIPELPSGSLGLSMGLIFGGAIGNIVDRVMRGEVVDFLDVDFPDITIRVLNIHMTRWPTFNIADSCVLVGIIMLLVILIRHGGRSEQEQPGT
jgi:signal peptidase II